MAGKGTTFDNDLLKLIFNGTAIANVADNAATSPITTLFVSLHTADPGSGTQATSEISYTGYARQTPARTTGGWTVTGNSVSPVANIQFPASTGGTGGLATHWAVGTAVSGTGKVLYCGSLTPNITITSGVTPIISTASTITEA